MTIENNSTKSSKGRGGARPGAGRPKGRKNVLTLEIESTAREFAADALHALKSVALRGKSESARVMAATALLDRGYGRPRQAIEHTGEGGGPMEIAVTHEIVDAAAVPGAS